MQKRTKIIIGIVVALVILSCITPKDEDTTTISDNTTEQQEATKEPKKEKATEQPEETTIPEELANLGIEPGKMLKDATGNFRLSRISEEIDISDYAYDYYKCYFKSDDEIHFIVNFTYKTTTKIAVIGGMLDVCTTEYVDDEELSAKEIGRGYLLVEKFLDVETGKEIEFDD